MEESGENPFSTRHVRPGALPFHPPSPGASGSPEAAFLGRLLERFEVIGRAGQIVGPHGGGKSTLLADLVRLWEQAGQRVVVVELHDGQRRLPIPPAELLREENPTLVAVDGYEQLARSQQRSLRHFCRRHQIGLVVTTHCSMGIPDLVRCAPCLELVEQIVRELLRDEHDRITAHEIRESFHKCEGNVREVLFEMYDLYEARAGEQPETSGP